MKKNEGKDTVTKDEASQTDQVVADLTNQNPEYDRLMLAEVAKLRRKVEKKLEKKKMKKKKPRLIRICLDNLQVKSRTKKEKRQVTVENY